MPQTGVSAGSMESTVKRNASALNQTTVVLIYDRRHRNDADAISFLNLLQSRTFNKQSKKPLTYEMIGFNVEKIP